MELSESDLTKIIQDALAHYKNKEFGYAKFIPMGAGFGVQFYDGPIDTPAKKEPERKKPDSNPMDISDLSNLTNPISPFNILGGFGGGSSGGGGASGDW